MSESKYLYKTRVFELMQRKDERGRYMPFSFQYCKKSTGELANVAIATLTSIHSKGNTINVLIDGERHPRTIRRCLITKFNNISIIA